MFYLICFYALEFILQLQILTVETEVDFGSCLGWEMRAVLCLWTVTEIFRLKIHLVEVQFYFFVWDNTVALCSVLYG